MRCFKNQADMPPGCPPSDIKPNDVQPVFRYIENQTVEAIDFQNHIERPLFYHPDKKCEAIALSFFTTEAAAEELRVIKKFRHKKISKGKITSTCGEHNIHNYHLNLWVYEGIDMLKVFLGEEDK